MKDDTQKQYQMQLVSSDQQQFPARTKGAMLKATK